MQPQSTLNTQSPTPGTARSSSVASHGSHTVVAPRTPVRTGVLHLRGAQPEPEPVEQSPHVQWADDTVDNENMGRKKSKVCCIYHRPRRFDESDSDSSCASDSDSDGPNDYERPARNKQPK
ncbi:Type 1 phosphatases regulator ypi1 [Coemansia sp. RSA 353]|nr:Type 1 phosphatases regulator ypi1 [Coemansia sp. RSA 637]KAJ2140891.1 Type 1 phosphatases regulator ypi1 [Coemansia sp. RSA 564]KAJ2180527.1 Type 1 phosphatases regulator ypi1 [Coemansia sp. RSA 532]KAJ2196302.1 Type 1 phosphatases regulator ypi1 [Coemansia sp. RSA 522]KAJ2209523.1 Type 1 phosphatases regulator ypi1 [Coemansia sp. RSA 520]KAJ2270083.1 Type 1 phosphatases regulator ypi1 [Coemansia sp. RSA 451]KAJ2270335.1 Type 1 phosphatases regulator ypi1 [Coemansia sp. RSA 371]KAJ227939